MKKNNIITIYELLGLIKDGKAPKKIRWKDNIFSFYNNDYLCEDSDFIDYHETKYLLCHLFSLPENVLNIKLEILEEDKPIIEKITSGKICSTSFTNAQLRADVDVLADKINEIIDYLEKTNLNK